MDSVLHPLLLHSSVTVQTQGKLLQKLLSQTNPSNAFDDRWFILWGMAIFLLCLTGPVQQV